MEITKIGIKRIKSKEFFEAISKLKEIADLQTVLVYAAITICSNKKGEVETNNQIIGEFINNNLEFRRHMRFLFIN